MNEKFYALKDNDKTAVFNQNSDKLIKIGQFNSPEVYQFDTYEQANQFITNIKSIHFDPDVIAYVDGSFRNQENMNGHGSSAVIVDRANQNIIHEINFAKDDQFDNNHQIMGELLATISAIEWAINNGCTHIKIMYDYEGIKSFIDSQANGHWQANTDGTRLYQRKVKELASKIDISFEHVKAHVAKKNWHSCKNYKYNKMADQLAKESL